MSLNNLNSNIKKAVLLAALLTATSVWAKTSTLLTVENNKKEEAGIEYRFDLETNADDSEVVQLKVAPFKDGKQTTGESEVIPVGKVIEGKSILPIPLVETGINGTHLVDKDLPVLKKLGLKFPVMFLQTIPQRIAELKYTEQRLSGVKGSFTKNGGKLVLRFITSGGDAIEQIGALMIPGKTAAEILEAKQVLSQSFGAIAIELKKDNGKWTLFTAQSLENPKCPKPDPEKPADTDKLKFIQAGTPFHDMFLSVDGSGFKTPCLYNKKK